MRPFRALRQSDFSSSIDELAGNGVATQESLYGDTGAHCDFTGSTKTNLAKEEKAEASDTGADRTSQTSMSSKKMNSRPFFSAAKAANRRAKAKAALASADERTPKGKMGRS